MLQDEILHDDSSKSSDKIDGLLQLETSSDLTIKELNADIRNLESMA